ncbi:hypothetical protein BDB00DRAFT_869616 [Zychaea mexicana]|uniref:uncharacterized protein n=1 Tax=Zychaea mexicana TaxID=64656 RepID=UPI0022FEF10C|nr:uncharacterized protein BDB00DRAFT_869616 [Zychaea mexicana]KAI9496319.1 hypothetical protein BDB00DRAFT_869616 [Zychaea mexicana]
MSPYDLSYDISALNKTYKHPGYDVDHPLDPHGVSVSLTAPSELRFAMPMLLSPLVWILLPSNPSMVPALVEGTLPQHRVTKLTPNKAPAAEQLAKIFDNSMTTIS